MYTKFCCLVYSEKYLKHLKRHKDRHTQLQLKECPHCKKMFKQFSYAPHVKFCERRMNKECRLIVVISMPAIGNSSTLTLQIFCANFVPTNRSMKKT